MTDVEPSQARSGVEASPEAVSRQNRRIVLCLLFAGLVAVGDGALASVWRLESPPNAMRELLVVVTILLLCVRGLGESVSYLLALNAGLALAVIGVGVKAITARFLSSDPLSESEGVLYYAPLFSTVLVARIFLWTCMAFCFFAFVRKFRSLSTFVILIGEVFGLFLILDLLGIAGF